MELKPWETGAVIPAEKLNGVFYVEVRYLQECVAEIARLKEELSDATDYRKTQYLTASEREKVQAVLNACYRQVMDRTFTVQGKE